jgi:hypothetical protein
MSGDCLLFVNDSVRLLLTIDLDMTDRTQMFRGFESLEQKYSWCDMPENVPVGLSWLAQDWLDESPLRTHGDRKESWRCPKK